MDQIGAIIGHISSKDVRITGSNPLPVYKGKLAVSRKEEPKGEKTDKQKQMDAYLKKYAGGVRITPRPASS